MVWIIVIGVIVVAAVAFFAMRGGSGVPQLPDEDDKGKLPKGDEKKPEPKKIEPPKGDEKKPEPKKAEPAAEPKKAEPAAEPVKGGEAAAPAPTAASEPAKVDAPKAEPEPAKSGDVAAPAPTAAEPAKTERDEPPPPPSQVVEPPTGPRVSMRPPPPPGVAQKRDVAALKKGLQQTRGGWVQRLVGLFQGKKELDPELLQELEETLITGDVGVATTQRLLEVVKDRLGKKDLANPDVVWETMREISREVMEVDGASFGAKAQGKTPLVILVVGVNGVGKTTTIGKLAAKYKDQGKKVYLSASDTFRAAAVAQIEAWGKRVGVAVVKGKDLTKPSAVVFDAVQTAAKENADVVLCDTAGRLHTKTPLMDELRKIRDAATKALPGAPHEILLVLDSTTGQNAIAQVKEFREALDLTGIVLTKLDGTAKGGVILGICDEFKLPVRFVGVGEKVDDLREFDAGDFTQALFARGEDDSETA